MNALDDRDEREKASYERISEDFIDACEQPDSSFTSASDDCRYDPPRSGSSSRGREGGERRYIDTRTLLKSPRIPCSSQRWGDTDKARAGRSSPRKRTA